MLNMLKITAYSLLVSVGFVFYCFQIEILGEGYYSAFDNIRSIILYSLLGIPLMLIGVYKIILTITKTSA